MGNNVPLTLDPGYTSHKPAPHYYNSLPRAAVAAVVAGIAAAPEPFHKPDSNIQVAVVADEAPYCNRPAFRGRPVCRLIGARWAGLGRPFLGRWAGRARR
jgi:hypothetical protein